MVNRKGIYRLYIEEGLSLRVRPRASFELLRILSRGGSMTPHRMSE
jgi:hypothetical protein